MSACFPVTVVPVIASVVLRIKVPLRAIGRGFCLGHCLLRKQFAEERKLIVFKKQEEVMNHFSKPSFIFLATIFTFFLVAGCAPKKIVLNQAMSANIAILPLGADTSMLNQDQIDLLNKNLQMMDNNLLNTLGRVGLQPNKISDESEFADSKIGRAHV